MKKVLSIVALVILGVAAFVLPAKAAPPTYVSITTFTPTGSGNKVYAFANHSDSINVSVHKIEMSNCTTSAITGGLIPFLVYGSTAVTDGNTSSTHSYGLFRANVESPSGIVASTNPTVANYENDQALQLPLSRPCYVNDDEAATANLSDACYDATGDTRLQPIALPAGKGRSIVLAQSVLATDFTAGCVAVRIYYTVD